jgi:hypothetical protein
MLTALAALALLTTHLLPGLLVVYGLGLGRSSFERWAAAAVLGGPVAAALYLLSLVSGSSSLYWALVVVVDVSAIVVFFLARRPAHEHGRPSRKALLCLMILVAVVVAAYLLTTGYLFRPDAEGNLLLDRVLQRDTLYHIGMARSLLSSYPPELISFSGVTVVYHAGYHLQVAAWARFFGIDVLDGIYRLGAVWSLGLLILSAFVLGRRFTRSDAGAVATAVLIFGAGLGFMFFSSPHADWWSLVFMDVTMVSVFLPNPLLPALPLLFVGLACLDDYLADGDRGALVGSAMGLIPLLFIKVFLGAQVLAAVTLAAMVVRSNRLRYAAVALCLISLFLLVPMFLSGGGNTAVGLRPLEIVRYSMEKLGWEEAALALTDILHNLGWAVAATLTWFIGFMGLRLIGLRALLRDVSCPSASVRSPMAYAILIGFFAALVFRIAPAEATGLSRLEAINDVVWFAAQSGILLWFWTAEIVVSFARKSAGRRIVAVAAVALLALPCTVQHFVHKTSWGVDVVPARVVEATGKVAEHSFPGDVWVEPLNRVRPSVVAYLAGRPVVHDSYVGYEYMFVPRDEYRYRRHAVAEFWRTNDPAYVSWFFDRYAVTGVFATPHVPLPEAGSGQVNLIFSNEAARLYDVGKSSDAGSITTPARLPIGPRGLRYFGAGWSEPAGSPRSRRLLLGNAELFVPRPSAEPLSLELELDTPHVGGTIYFGGGREELAPEQETVLVTWPGAEEPGLHRLEIEWRGSRPLVVKRIETVLGQP